VLVFISNLHFIDETAGMHNIPLRAFEGVFEDIRDYSVYCDGTYTQPITNPHQGDLRRSRSDIHQYRYMEKEIHTGDKQWFHRSQIPDVCSLLYGG